MDIIMKHMEDYDIYDENHPFFRDQLVRPTLIEVHISDLHFGAMDPKYQFKILSEQFLDKIENMRFDILSIDGDLFHHKFLSNQDSVMYATLFINRTIEICKKFDATLVLLHGTYEHDAGQLRLFYHYLSDPTIDIRIVEEVKFEYIKGAKILCIPELYGRGKEYYDKFLYASCYDSVFMHGEIRGAIYNPSREDKGLDTIGSPIFSIEDFALCRGPIISGHIHTPGCFNSYFYYCGSPYRWQFGEEEDKGFLIVLHNLETQQHYTHMEKIISQRYDTISIQSLISEDPKKIIQYIDDLQSQGIDYIRIDAGENIEDKYIPTIEILKSYYKTNNRIKFKNTINKNKIESTKMNKEALTKFKDYDYILNPNMSPYEIFCRYVNQQEKCEFITVKELKEILKNTI